ncbi:MAG: nucleotidyltransferase domain-containing protein [Candidatus Aenigmarchaeota archaeon]|nr:nucleotidyltransferase domain-containing protein [Candidatus Aenigmarchaeota archaeon]
MNLQQKYQRTAREIAARIRQEGGDAVDAVILYGSVARREAGKHSDIDLFVLTRRPSARRTLSKARSSVDLRHGTVSTLVFRTPQQFMRGLQAGSPFLRAVVEEGVILYDDGVFRRARQAVS